MIIESLKSGACGFLSKPFQEIDLLNEVRTALEHPRKFDSTYLTSVFHQLQARGYGDLDSHKLLQQPQMEQLIHLLEKQTTDIDLDTFVLQSNENNDSASSDHYLSLRNVNIGDCKIDGLSEYFYHLVGNFNYNTISGSHPHSLRFCFIEQNLSLDTYPMIQDSANILVIQVDTQTLPLSIIPYQKLPEEIEEILYEWVSQEITSLFSGEAVLHKITGREFQDAFNNIYPQVNVILELVIPDTSILISVNIPYEIASTDAFYNHILQWKLTNL